MPETHLPHFGGKFLLTYKLGNCREYSDIMTYAMRALGIPGGTDLMVQNHTWNYVRDKSGQSHEFELYNIRPAKQTKNTERKRGKTYRTHFDVQTNALPVLFRNKKLPNDLNSFLWEDVSSEYFPNMALKIKIDKISQQDNILYLCLFDNLKWVSVGWSEIKRGEAVFTGAEPDIFYLPAYFVEGKFIPATDPLLLKEDNQALFYTPDTIHTETVFLRSKYFRTWFEERIAYLSVGSRFQGANRPDFSDAVTLFSVDKEAEPFFYETDINLSRKFRYVRYLTSERGYINPDVRYKDLPPTYGNIAEMTVYSIDNQELKGKIIGSGGAGLEKNRALAFDNEPLTFFEEYNNPTAWVGLDFGIPQTIIKIRYLFRNGDNRIREGDLYELFYFAKGAAPVSLGQQYGNREQRLVFDNVPKNALLWLRDFTRGKEERIFTYENGEQVWW